jgi:putative membrane protein insertion efficiency factor
MNLKTTNSIIMRFKLLLITFTILGLFATSQVQAAGKLSSKMAKLRMLNKPVKNQVDYKAYLKKSKNELDGTAALLFLTYKSFFSSQDQNSCVFTPSCSVYAIESLQRKNPFVAYLKIFDRLERCHPLVTKGEYQFHTQSQRYYDPAY